MTHTKQFVRRILSIVIPMTLFLGFGIDLYSPSFPLIAKSLNTNEQLVQLTIATYFFGYTIGLLFFGPISDAIGRKKPLIFGFLLYCLLSLFCAFSTNIDMLLTFRFFQGAGAASVGVMFRSILSDVFMGKQLATSMSYTSMSYRTGPIIAPLIGGYLTTYFGWSSNFYFLMIFSGLFALSVFFFLPETHTDLSPIHLKSILKKYKALFQCRPFIGGGITNGILYAMMIIFNIVGPFFIQDILGYSPIDFGHIAFFLGLAALCGILFNRLLLQFLSVEKIIRLGMISLIFICILQTISAFLFPVNLYSLLIPIACIVFASGLVVSNMLSQILELVPHSKGITSSLSAILVVATTGILTALSSFLKSDTIIPFALAYLAITFIAYFCYRFLFLKRAKE
ncbi:MAG: Bicyclomycin resistance protein [Chlamydiae bacterium]|nr:Bicyclomycin resistance protein [Chlamydiota bacterium]